MKEKNWVRLMDSFMIFALLFNMGALFLTNYTEVHSNQEPSCFVELNPVQREISMEHSKVVVDALPSKARLAINASFFDALKMAFIYAFIFIIYMWNRRMYTRRGMNIDRELLFLMTPTLYFAVTMMDFVNDLGLVMGLLF